MKKVIMCLVIIAFIVIIIYRPNSTSIKLNSNNVSRIGIDVIGVSLISTDKGEIEYIIKDINKILYNKKIKSKIINMTPDASIVLIGNKGNIIDRIDFYTGVAVNNKSRLEYSPFAYFRLIKLCAIINIKQKIESIF